jgi:L-ascorbate metabolism protein UlaG (beta-lactamase superfamily)
MKLTSLGHSAFRIEAGAAKIVIDPFLSDNPSWGKGWSGYLRARTRYREVTDEGDCGEGSGCGNGRSEAG